MKHSVSCLLRAGDTSTGFVVKIRFGALECAGDIVFVDLFDLCHLNALLEAIHLRFHEHDPCHRAEDKLDIL